MNPHTFQQMILKWYADHGRHELPWRVCQTPYTVLVSELMLQQTQVDRVIPKFVSFMAAFPTIEALAQAPLSQVLGQWQGLGYNRRAQYLHQAAQAIQSQLQGIFPTQLESLQALPGIGPYTSSAICAFAFNQPVLVIETNIRAVYLYHFFPNQTNVPDSDLVPHILSHIYQPNPREWYAALMDYGSWLKKTNVNPARQSAHHTVQTRFEGSRRQVRGSIIRQLTAKNQNKQQLLSHLEGKPEWLDECLEQMEREGLVRVLKSSQNPTQVLYSLAE